MVKKIITVISLCFILLITAACRADGNGQITQPEALTEAGTETAPDTEPETAAEPVTDEETADTETTYTEETTMSISEEAAAARTLLDTADGKRDLTVFGNSDADASRLEGLQREIDRLERNGHMVSFIIADVKGGFGIAYNCDKKWTSQSTIKAPYLTSVLMRDASVFETEKRLIKAVITVSDNDAYATLREKYGNAPFRDFCKASGVSSRHSADLYPRSITVRDMAKLWTTMYEFLNTREDMETYISYFTGTAFSCVYQGIGDKYKVQTKAGWESGTDYDGPGGTPDARFTDGDPQNDEIATNDTGIVYAGDRPYIIAIFTNVQSDPPTLIPLVRAIDDAHTALTN